ncbi:MAG: site-2 protease family protein [Acaryochloridaceae cyanobacterium SU_2_1]|nr:site-2 protease family protein [Acaryochloridaceae cyanobacterium SU_2_1]
MIWISLGLFGLILYFIVHYGVSRVTTTPTWMLWLALMIPVVAVGLWASIYGTQQQMPASILIPCFVLSLVLYLYLVRVNQRKPSDLQATDVRAADTEISGIKSPTVAPSPKPENLLSKEEESQLQTCFPQSIYYLQQVDHRPQVVICRGRLRSQPEEAYHTIQENIQAQFGDRFLVVFQPGAMNKPFFVLVPNPQTQTTKTRTGSITRPGLALGLFLLTGLTTTFAGASFTDTTLTSQALFNQPHLLLKGLPYSLSLLSILGLHELGHYFASRLYKLKATLPYFIPTPYTFFRFGTLGAFIQMRSPIPHRKALFDIGIAGPLAGFVITLPILIWGLLHSTIVPLPDKSIGLPFDAFDPTSSVLFTLLSKAVFGANLSLAEGIDLQPMAIAGWLGLIVTALNLMPVGQLDGGHIVHAMFGQRTGAVIGQVARLLVLILAFIQPLLLLWAIILLFMPTTDQPALNDVSELDNTRDLLGLIALAILAMIILPMPHNLAHLLYGAF